MWISTPPQCRVRVGAKPQRRRIDIAPHRLDRRNGTELVEHGLGSYVTGVQDLVDTV